MHNGTAVVVQNYYWAKPGNTEAVYQHRLHASAVRAQLGLPGGRVLRRTGASDWLPDVMWECTYASLAARKHDLDILEASTVFREVMAHMRTLIRRFERASWTIVSSAEPSSTAR